MVAGSWMPTSFGRDRNQGWGQKGNVIIVWMVFGTPGLDEFAYLGREEDTSPELPPNWQAQALANAPFFSYFVIFHWPLEAFRPCFP